jgi:tyrosyl-tRNA synthetase
MKITENLEIISPENGLEEKLKKKQLIVKMGFDPTSPDLHLGHAVAIKKLKEFQDLGHKVVIIIGDFTAMIGDPSGKDKTRPPLEKKDIEKNAKTYIDQLSKILDVKKIEVRRNSEWYGEMKMEDVIKLLSSYTVQQIMTRNDFKDRFEKGSSISMHEIFYPLLQGYDSVILNADIEMGGQDQLFNLHVGRDLQEKEGQEPQVILCTAILRGLDGVNKMSKSLNNYIGLTDDAITMYGKVMSIPDELIEEYIDLASSFDNKKEMKDRLRKENPMIIKKELAFNIVEQYHSLQDAELAKKDFENKFQKRKLDDIDFIEISINDIKDKITLLDLISDLLNKSKSACRKLIEQGAVSIDGKKVVDINIKNDIIKENTILKVGKLNYYKFK